MFLSDEAIELLWPLVTETPSVSAAYEIWAACGLPPQPLSPDLAGPVYCDDPDEPLLSEAERLRAADPALWQLVYIPPIFDSSGMEVLTFDSLEEAEAKLNSLKLGEIDEGGGIIFKAGVPVAEKLVLKYCEKEDFHGFLKDVTKEPERPLERSLEDNIKALSAGEIQAAGPCLLALEMPDKREAALKLTAAEKSLKVGKAQESLKDSEAALEIFRSLGADGEGPLPDVLRLVIDGKRMLAVQLQQAGNRRGEAAMLISLAEIALSQCSRPYASGPVPPVKPLEEALHMLRDASPGDKKLEGLALLAMSETYMMKPALVEAKSAADAALKVFEELGDSLNKAKALRDGGRCSLAGGKVAAGEQAVQAAIEIFREQDARRSDICIRQIGFLPAAADTTDGFARCAIWLGCKCLDRQSRARPTLLGGKASAPPGWQVPALRRIRTLMSFAAKACAYEGAAGARCQDLAAVLQSCEVALLKGTNEMPTIPVGPSETSSVFLESILPKLLSEEPLAFEVRLRLMLQDLSDHNDALRRELEELSKRESGGKDQSEPTSATDACSIRIDPLYIELDVVLVFGSEIFMPKDYESSEVEAPMQIAELQLALAEAYEQLARWQQENIWLGPSKHSPMEGLDALQAAIEKGHEEVRHVITLQSRLIDKVAQEVSEVKRHLSAQGSKVREEPTVHRNCCNFCTLDGDAKPELEPSKTADVLQTLGETSEALPVAFDSDVEEVVQKVASESTLQKVPTVQKEEECGEDVRRFAAIWKDEVDEQLGGRNAWNVKTAMGFEQRDKKKGYKPKRASTHLKTGMTSPAGGGAAISAKAQRREKSRMRPSSAVIH
eukprot:g3093.t1